VGRFRPGWRRDPRTAAAGIDARCRDGAVRLEGLVDTQEEAEAAAEVSAAVEGARSIDNQLSPAGMARLRLRRGG